MDEVEVGAVIDSVKERVFAGPLYLVPADVRKGRGLLQPDRAAGQHAEGRRAVFVAAFEQQLEPEADPEERATVREPGADGRGQGLTVETGHGRRRCTD